MIVRVDRDKLIDKLPELLSLVDEMKDLVPDWHSLEADELDEKITLIIESLIEIQRCT